MSKKVKKNEVPVSVIVPRCLDIPQLATYLSASEWSARRLLWSNQIPHFRIGKRFVCDIADVDRYIELRKGAL
jgi:hypothetical protein